MSLDGKRLNMRIYLYLTPSPSMYTSFILHILVRDRDMVVEEMLKDVGRHKWELESVNEL